MFLLRLALAAGDVELERVLNLPEWKLRLWRLFDRVEPMGAETQGVAKLTALVSAVAGGTKNSPADWLPHRHIDSPGINDKRLALAQKVGQQVATLANRQQME